MLYAQSFAHAERATMKIQDVMTRRVCTVSGRASLADAARLMWEKNCGVIPVVDDAEAIIGVITDRDVCMGALTQARPIHEIPVTMSMSKNVATCRDTDDLETVEAIMAERRIRRVPVVDDTRRAVGIVSLDDLARVALELRVGKEKVTLNRGLARTLGILSQPEPLQALSAIS